METIEAEPEVVYDIFGEGDMATKRQKTEDNTTIDN